MSKDRKMCFKSLITFHSDPEYCLISDIIKTSILTKERKGKENNHYLTTCFVSVKKLGTLSHSTPLYNIIGRITIVILNIRELRFRMCK